MLTVQYRLEVLKHLPTSGTRPVHAGAFGWHASRSRSYHILDEILPRPSATASFKGRERALLAWQEFLASCQIVNI